MIMSSVVHTLSSRCSLGYWEIGILGNWDIGFWDLCDVIPIWRSKRVHMVSNIILYYTLDLNKFFLNFKPHV